MNEHGEQPVDVVIVGGGPAGLSLALALVRARRSVVVIDAGQPRNGVAPHMHGVLGHDGVPPTRLLELGRAEVEGYGGQVVAGEVSAVAVAADGIRVSASGKGASTPSALAGTVSFLARRLVVATGLRDELPDFEGISEQWGRGVVVCPYCDGWERRDEVIGVIATSVGSVHQAQMLRQWSDRIVYFSNGVGEPDAATADALRARGIELEVRSIRRLVVDERDAVTGIELTDGTIAPVGAVFTGPTPVPNDGLLRAIGAATKQTPMGEWIETDADGRTSVPGVWAVGNVVDPRANVPVSLGAGSLLAAAVNMDLIEEEIAAAVEHQGARAAV